MLENYYQIGRVDGTVDVSDKLRVSSMALRQACSECRNGEGLEGVSTVIRMAPFVECWRCDGHGLVEVYDDLKPKIKVLNHEQR